LIYTYSISTPHRALFFPNAHPFVKKEYPVLKLYFTSVLEQENKRAKQNETEEVFYT
jgi:hypothetical protein